MFRTVVAGVAGVLLLAGCSSFASGQEDAAQTAEAAPTSLTLPPAASSASSTSAASTSASSTSAASRSAAQTNERGNVPQTTGQQAGIRGADGSQAVIFSVDRIVVDQACSARSAPRPVNGHYLGLAVRVTTGNLDSLGGAWSMTAGDFAVRTPDGDVRFDLATEGAARCLDGPQRFPTTSLRSHQQYVGTIVLDSPATTGVLVFSPPGLQGNGWEWPF